jgi:hypothetical protein
MYVRLQNLHEYIPTFGYLSFLCILRGRSIRHACVETMNKHAHMISHSMRAGRGLFPKRKP